jgi:hypothetical protein
MMRRIREQRAARAVVLAVALVGAAACSGGGKKSAAPTTHLPPAPVTTTSTTAPGTGSLVSTDKVAVQLDQSLLSAAEVARALALPAPPTKEAAGPTATAQGPLTEQGLLSVLPNAAVYKPIYDKAAGGVGANVLYHASTPKLDIDILTAKFATQAGGQSFVTQASDIATTFAQGKATPHPEMALGVLPATLQAVIRVPPGPLTDPTKETIITDILYADGIDYLMTLMGPPGAVTDAQVIALAKAQDAKYQTLKASFGA